MSYDIVQLRWDDDTQFAKPVLDQTGYRLPVKVGEISGSVAISGDVKVTSDVIVKTIDEGNESLIQHAEQSVVPLLQAILAELRVISTILGQGLNVPDDPATLRYDPTYTTP